MSARPLPEPDDTPDEGTTGDAGAPETPHIDKVVADLEADNTRQTATAELLKRRRVTDKDRIRIKLIADLAYFLDTDLATAIDLLDGMIDKHAGINDDVFF